MEEKEVRRSPYMQGTVVRQRELEVPDQSRPNERRRRQLEQQREQQLIREGRKHQREFSYLYLTGFMGICAAIFVLLGIFVYGEASLYQHSRSVENKQNYYEQLVENNDATEARLNASIDLDEIFRIATERLGMSYPAVGQIIDYQKEDNEYVRKYEEIPNN